MRSTCVILLLCAACSFGPRAADHFLAVGPAGVTAEVAVKNDVSDGELLAVSDSGLWLLMRGAPTWAPYGAMDSVWFPSLGGDARFGMHEVPSAELRRRLELGSRFPNGMSSGLLAALVHAYRSDSVKVLR